MEKQSTPQNQFSEASSGATPVFDQSDGFMQEFLALRSDFLSALVNTKMSKPAVAVFSALQQTEEPFHLGFDHQHMGEFSSMDQLAAFDKKSSIQVLLIRLGGIYGSLNDGLQRLGELRLLLPQVHMVVVLKQFNWESLCQSVLAGASGCLSEDASAQVLETEIRDVIKGGAALNTFSARKIVQFFQKRATAAFLPKPRRSAELSQREKQVIHLLGQKLAYKEIGAELNISVETVRRHCHNIYEKLNVSRKSQALIRYSEMEAGMTA
jgi:DNA-binding NarL/FixJ family response regulator